MWFKRFLQLIEKSPLGAALEKRRELLEFTGEPGRIYVENVRSFFGVSHRVARAMCDLAVRQGFFERCAAFLCPRDERVLFDTCEPEATPPSHLNCEVCEALEEETSQFEAATCRQIQYYRVRAAH
jgi:hypothetical protein